MSLTASDLKPIEKAISDMTAELKNYQTAILQATAATDSFVKKEEEQLKKIKEVSLAVKTLGGKYQEEN